MVKQLNRVNVSSIMIQMGNKRQQLVNKVNQAQSQVNDDYQKVNQSPNNHQLQVKLTQDQKCFK